MLCLEFLLLMDPVAGPAALTRPGGAASTAAGLGLRPVVDFTVPREAVLSLRALDLRDSVGEAGGGPQVGGETGSSGWKRGSRPMEATMDLRLGLRSSMATASNVMREWVLVGRVVGISSTLE